MNRETGRAYPIEGQGKFWSVTTILDILAKPALVQWAANCAADYYHMRISDIWHDIADYSHGEICEIYQQAKTAHKIFKDDAADIGTQVHDWIESWCVNRACPGMPEDETVFDSVTAFLGWAKSVDLHPLASEIKIWHPGHRYAGRFDLIATMKQGRQRKPRTYLIDIKTSSAIYDTMLYQLAAYEEGYKVTDGTHKIDGRGIIRLDKKTGKPEWKEYSDIEQVTGWEIFRRLADVYYLIKGTPD